MSVIFFEGFNRALDLNYWTLTASSDYPNSPPIYNSSGRTNGRYLLGASNTYAATQSTLTVKFAPATLTKVYIGFAIDYVSSQRMSYGVPFGGGKQKVFTIYDGSDVELFNISALGGGATNGLALSLYSNNYFSGNFEIGSFIITSATNIPDATVYMDGYGNGNFMTGWNYLEFEIDLISNTFAARRNGQTLYTQSTGALTLLLPMAMPSVGAFQFHGATNQVGVDDMYVATSAGATANTWLGPNTRVYSPAFTAVSTPAEWSNGEIVTPVNSDDNDNSFISTNVINEVHVFDTVVSPSPSDAIVGGIKLSSVARKVTLDAAYRHVYKHTDAAIHDLSPKFNLTTTTSYKRSSAFVFENPATILPWTLTELDNGKFGVKSVEYVLGTALTPTFGTSTATADGFTVPISNYDADYTWAGTATASGTVTISRIGLVTITGVAANTSSTATITTTSSDAVSSGSATVTKISLDSALTPTLGTQTSIANGFTVQITNYDSAYTWAGTATASGTVVVTNTGSGTGLATITGVAALTSSTATITTTRTGYATGAATATATSLDAVLTPAFGTPTATADGFTAQITNYDALYTWASSATASGSVSINGSGLVTVTGVAANTSSTATITTTRTGHVAGTATVTKTSLAVALTPVFVSTTATADGFTVQIANYNASYTWAGTATASGTVAVSGTGLVTVTGVAALTSSTATITTTRTGYVGGSAPVTVTSLGAVLTPTFGTPIATADGFTVQISNYNFNAAYTWAGTATASGTVAIDGNGLITVTGVAAATSSTATITVTRTGYVTGTATVTKTSLAAALTPAFGTPSPTATGFTVSITNYDAAYTWAGTATASGSVAISAGGLATITNVAANTSSTATITTTKANTVGGSATVTATSSLAAALTPTFGTPSPTATGFTVSITNYDAAYTWAGTATASGSVAINGSGLVTITNVAINTSSTATITTTKANTVGGSATVTATSSLAAALTPTFASATATADGFTAQITNYDATYTWAGTATASGTVVVSGSGLVTVTGVAANTSSTATITTTKANTVGGSATVTATSLLAALTPAFGSTTATADGFTVQISNYSSAYTWAGTATASGTVVVSGTGLVTVTGVAANTSSTATITTTQAGYAGGSATVTATSLLAALTPAFGSTTSTSGGFTVQISNYDALYTWAGTATASGTVVVSGSGLVTVTGVAASTSSTATITTTRTGYAGGSATVTATSTAPSISITPNLASPQARSNGGNMMMPLQVTVIFTAVIPNGYSMPSWSITGTNPPSNFSSSGTNTQSITFTSVSTAPHFNITCSATNMNMMGGGSISGTYTGYEIT